MSDARIFIAIAVCNRLKLASLCVPTIRLGMKKGDDVLVIYNDGSDEIVPDETRLTLFGCAEGVVFGNPPIGIDAQRRKHFLDFWHNRNAHNCTHLYLTDADAIHDPAWRERGLLLQERHEAPVCLYRTQTHADYKNNIYHDDPDEDVLWQRFAPGVSYLLTMDMVEKVVKVMPEKWSWDWTVPSILGHRMAISRTSYVDHIGMGGAHDPERGVGPERALDPTPWLVKKREEIILCLTT